MIFRATKEESSVPVHAGSGGSAAKVSGEIRREKLERARSGVSGCRWTSSRAANALCKFVKRGSLDGQFSVASVGRREQQDRWKAASRAARMLSARLDEPFPDAGSDVRPIEA
ncbi:hypothetical protein K0M31_007851 [Melipona bicolor]|uniref:Uncharacterized protein n=1 Tax=Melipona bicolor TaxID=60889 RepID=A0AA40GD00_9HYME|nr:hypothetical protein K0M31_007851 [Melipona bicolor]